MESQPWVDMSESPSKPTTILTSRNGLVELNEELEVLNAEAHQLEERIAENVVKILEDR